MRGVDLPQGSTFPGHPTFNSARKKYLITELKFFLHEFIWFNNQINWLPLFLARRAVDAERTKTHFLKIIIELYEKNEVIVILLYYYIQKVSYWYHRKIRNFQRKSSFFVFWLPHFLALASNQGGWGWGSFRKIL